MKDDAADIDRMLTDQLEAVLDRYWPGWVYGHGKASAHPEPKGKGDLGSFEVYLRPYGRQKRGDWFRRSQGIGGRPIQLIAYAITGDHKAYREAFAEARDFLGIKQQGLSDEEKRMRAKAKDAARKKEEKARDLEEKKTAARGDHALGIWETSDPIKGTPAETYLRKRGASILSFASLRCAELKYPFHAVGTEQLTWPVLVCRVVGADMEFKAIWRIYLTPEGEKAPVVNPKLGLGPAGGGAVWLGWPTDTVNVCEGVETGLGIVGLVGGKEPVAATLSTSGMVNFDPPSIVKRVLIWPDGDTDHVKVKNGLRRMTESPGLKAAKTLASRLIERGLAVAVQPTPRNGMDYLDVWNATREKSDDKSGA